MSLHLFYGSWFGLDNVCSPILYYFIHHHHSGVNRKLSSKSVNSNYYLMRLREHMYIDNRLRSFTGTLHIPSAFHL